MPKDPLKYSMGLAPEYGVLGDLTGSLMETAGNIPWLQALGQTAGQALDWADVSGAEYMEAPWYQRAAAGAIDPGGTIAEVGGLAAGVTDPETLLKMKMMGGLVPDATPGAVSPAMVAGKFTGGTKATRAKLAQGLREVRRTSEVGAPTRKAILRQSRKGITLQEELPEAVIEHVKKLREQGALSKGTNAAASYSHLEGAPGGTIALPETAGISHAAHEITHAGTRGAPTAELAAMQDKVSKGATIHPRAEYAGHAWNRMDETISYTIQDLVEGRASDIMKMDPGLRADVFEYLKRNWEGPVAPRLADFATTPASKVPLMEAEMDPLLKVMGQ